MRYFFLDTETTGLVKPTRDFLAQPGICQIGIVCFDFDPAYKTQEGKEMQRNYVDFMSYVNPEIAKWEDGAIKTHGITPEMVKDAPTFFEVFEDIARLAKGCDVWGGYNTKFDKDVLAYQLERYGFSRHFPWPRHEVDVMRLVKEKCGEQGKRGEKNIKLVEAYERFIGKPMSSAAHDALADIKATVEIFMEVRNG
jgi:DNA polymerase III epsilon subunit-like protein